MDQPYRGYSAAQALRDGGRETVRDALVAARQRTLVLADAYADALAGAGMQVAYRTTINPPLWELGHIGWFQEYWIARNRERSRGVDCDPAHERRPSLIDRADAFYDSSRVEHRSRWTLPLPGAVETRAYLAQSLKQTLDLLDELAPDASAADLYFYRLVALHEEMHAEAATYMARALEVPLAPQPRSRPAQLSEETISVPAQSFVLGYPDSGFAFDNELGAHEVHVDAFMIDATPVSWSRFIPFVESGGYRKRKWWSEAGWDWLAGSGLAGPTATGSPGDAAVHLTCFEAEAWCRWAGRRLPTEAEWECAAVTQPAFRWGHVWEWTATAFEPYPAFTPHPYREYSAPWFGTRRVLRGACPATSASLAHPRYRNFFEPQRSDVFAGFRSCG